MAEKSSTNGSLLKEVLKEVRAMQTSLIKIDGRVENLEVWRIASDASKDAIDKYKAETQRNKEAKSKTEILQALLPFIVALTALIYGIITYLGRT